MSWRWLGVGCASAVLCGLTMGCERKPAEPPAPPNDLVRVLALTGTVTLDGRALTADYEGRGGGLLKAEDGAMVTVKIGPDTVWGVIGPAEVRLEATPKRRGVSLIAGRIKSAFGQAVSDVTLRVGAAVAGGRGIVMYAEQTSATPDYICVCEGKAEIRHDAGGFARVHAQHHDQPLRVMPKGYMPQPMIGHRDKDVDEIKSMLAR